MRSSIGNSARDPMYVSAVDLNGNSSAGAPGSFGPTAYTFTGPNQQLVLPCAGAASILFELSGTFTGTLNSANSADVDTTVTSPARLWMSGVGSIGRSTITGTGVAYKAQYRGIAGGSVYVLTSGADFVGVATVAIIATASAPVTFVHGPVHGADEEALRAGRAYTTTTGIGSVVGGNHMVLYLSNPANSGVRIFIPTRRFTAVREDNLTPVGPQYYGIGNPTGNIPAGVGVISNRGDGAASPIISRFAVVSTANLPTGGTTAAGNLASTPDLPFERTLEPGKSFAQVMSNTSSVGLGGAFNILMCITAAFYQEPI